MHLALRISVLDRGRLSSSDSFKNQDGIYAHLYNIDGPGAESLEICKTFQT